MWVSHSSLYPGQKVDEQSHLYKSNTKQNCQQFASKENKMLTIEVCNLTECFRAETMMSERLPPHPCRCINMDAYLIFLNLFLRLQLEDNIKAELTQLFIGLNGIRLLKGLAQYLISI